MTATRSAADLGRPVPGSIHADALPAASHIGKYRIDGVLGEGAMGIVYRGFDASVGRRVAIKTVRKELLDGRQPWDAIARFRSEARAAGRLSHPGIVTVYEFSEDERCAHLVCEFVDGVALDRWLARHGRADLPTALAWMDALLDALECAHAQGVVHRDVKAANLLVLDRQRIKLADFGIAQVDGAEHTLGGMMVGTPCCMAPEQIQGGPIDRRTDVFAAGVLLYELLTGRRPFEGASDAVLQRILSHAPAAPSSLRPDLPPAVDGIVLRALAKQPGERHASAAAFRAALQRLDGPARRREANGADPTLLAPSAGRRPAAWDVPTERSWNPATLAQVETRLRSHVGPIAGTLVHRLSRTTRTLDDLLAGLARHIPLEAQRNHFVEGLRDAPQAATGNGSLRDRAGETPPMPAAPSHTSQAALDPAWLAEVEARLARCIGPMASIAMRRAARDGPDGAALCRRLAQSVPDARARRGFLAECGIDPSGIA